MTPSILIITNEFDRGATEVERVLALRDQKVARIHPRDIPLSATLAWRFHRTTGGRIASPGGAVGFDQVRAAWWRAPHLSRFSSELSAEERVFARMETGHALNGVWHAMGCAWVNHPMRVHRAFRRCRQSAAAAAAGIGTLKSIITADLAAARAFLDDCSGKVIHRRMHERPKWSSSGRSSPVEPRPVTNGEDLASLLNSLRGVPCLLHEDLPSGRRELAFVVGGEVHAGQLPPVVAAQCAHFVSGLGLELAGVEVVVKPDGGAVLIDLDPHPDWLAGQPADSPSTVAGAIASLLARGGAIASSAAA